MCPAGEMTNSAKGGRHACRDRDRAHSNRAAEPKPQKDPADHQTQHRRSRAAQHNREARQSRRDRSSQLPPALFLDTVQRSSQEDGEHHVVGEIADVSQRARRPHDGPESFADVIGLLGQPRVPTEVLRDSIERNRHSRGHDCPQIELQPAPVARQIGRGERREKQHRQLRDQAEAPPASSRRSRSKRGSIARSTPPARQPGSRARYSHRPSRRAISLPGANQGSAAATPSSNTAIFGVTSK